ncbi:MAG: SMP-30/gluconolactonase/LRE family protein [Paludibacteraceae bacterium]|nr:SMP-30/gluconolactonase/LRE family protein [Paludibacteraceae bacterium]
MNKTLIFASLLMASGAISSCDTTEGTHPKNGTSMNDSLNVKCAVAVDTVMRVGEGPIWDYKYNRLLWIDTQGSLLVYTPKDGKNREIKLSKQIGTVIPFEEDRVVVGLEDGIYKLTLSTEQLEFIADPEGREAGNRYNDGKCDAKGRLWIGTMDKDCTPLKANFFRVDPDGKGRKILDGVTISNGVAWSPDGKTMYYQDTPTLKVSAFDFDEEKGEISNRREIITLSPDLGTPDGNTIDAEGMLWVANWGAACVTRWNPATGELLQKIEVPAENVSALAFGGEALDELYITTCSLWMSEGGEAKYPEAGKMFVVKPGVKGMKCNYWGEVR